MRLKDLLEEVEYTEQIMLESEDTLKKFVDMIKDTTVAEKVKEIFADVVKKKKFVQDYMRLLSKKMSDNKINLSDKQDASGAKAAEEENDKRGAFIGALAYAGITVNLPTETVPA